MPSARLTVSIPAGTWIHDVSVGHPEANFRVLGVLADEGTGVALLEVRAADPVPIISDIEGAETVLDIDLLYKREDATLLQVETADPRLLVPMLEAEIPLQTPFGVDEGAATWELTTSADRLATLGERLEAAGIAFDLEALRDPRETADRLLTDRQQEALLAAIEAGYYETPREITLTDLSSVLGISKATGSDLLHRAESAVLTWFVDEYLDGARRPPEGPVED